MMCCNLLQYVDYTCHSLSLWSQRYTSNDSWDGIDNMTKSCFCFFFKHILLFWAIYEMQWNAQQQPLINEGTSILSKSIKWYFSTGNNLISNPCKQKKKLVCNLHTSSSTQHKCYQPIAERLQGPLCTAMCFNTHIVPISLTHHHTRQGKSLQLFAKLWINIAEVKSCCRCLKKTKLRSVISIKY